MTERNRISHVLVTTVLAMLAMLNPAGAQQSPLGVVTSGSPPGYQIFTTALSNNWILTVNLLNPWGGSSAYLYEWKGGTNFAPVMLPQVGVFEAICSINPSGTIAVGFADNQAFVYYVNEGILQILPLLNGATAARAFSVSDSGLIGGASYRNQLYPPQTVPTFWNVSPTALPLPPAWGQGNGIVQWVDTYMVGDGSPAANPGGNVYYLAWTSTGELLNLGEPPTPTPPVNSIAPCSKGTNILMDTYAADGNCQSWLVNAVTSIWKPVPRPAGGWPSQYHSSLGHSGTHLTAGGGVSTTSPTFVMDFYIADITAGKVLLDLTALFPGGTITSLPLLNDEGGSAFTVQNVSSGIQSLELLAPLAVSLSAPPEIKAGSSGTGTASLNIPCIQAATIKLSSSSSLVTVPASLHIAAKNTTVTFPIKAALAAHGQSATITAALGPSTTSISIQID